MGSTGRRGRRVIGRSVTISFEIAVTQDMSSSLRGHRCLDIFALRRRINSCEMHNMQILDTYLFLRHGPKRRQYPPGFKSVTSSAIAFISAYQHRAGAQVSLQKPVEG